MIKVPSEVTVTLQQGHKRDRFTVAMERGLAVLVVAHRRYLVLFPKISVPLLQSIVAFGAARGWQGMLISPPRAAGISLLTGFCLKSGARAAGRRGVTDTLTL